MSKTWFFVFSNYKLLSLLFYEKLSTKPGFRLSVMVYFGLLRRSKNYKKRLYASDAQGVLSKRL